MTTQDEVIEAFASFEERPRRASNFRLVESDEVAQRAYLVGGRYAVYAKREPLSRIITYPEWRRDYGWHTGLLLTNSAMRRQAMLVKRRLLGSVYNDSWNEEHDDTIEMIESENTPTVDNFDDLSLS
jgi:hypothetical protein